MWSTVSQFPVEVAAASDVGPKRRLNEDAYGFDQELGAYIMSDGMGGAAAGEIASRMAVESIMEYLKRPAVHTGRGGVISRGKSENGRRLIQALLEANRQIYQDALATGRIGMGCTVVAVLISQGTASVAHVGDSRAYRFRGGQMQQLTKDHSLLAEMLERGLLSPGQAARSPHRNVVTRSLGPAAQVEPGFSEFPLLEGDQLLLATDGLTKPVPPEEILRIATSGKVAQDICDDLIRAAKGYGSDDNISCMLIRGRPAGEYDDAHRAVSHA